MNKTAFLTILASAWLGASALGQEAPPPPQPAADPPSKAGAPPPASPCPKIDVQSIRSVREGQTATFAANITGGDPKVQPQLLWSVNSGMIKNGQETRKIEVDTSGAGHYREITADLWVGGYPGECLVQSSATVKVIPPAFKAEEFGEMQPEAEAERMKVYVQPLLQTDDRLLIIGYSGRTTPRGQIIATLNRMKAKLVEDGVESVRVTVVDGGYREEAAFETWLVPQGAEAPKPTPTIDRREIVTPRTSPATPARRPVKPSAKP
jgi:hypothetical protein